LWVSGAPGSPSHPVHRPSSLCSVGLALASDVWKLAAGFWLCFRQCYHYVVGLLSLAGLWQLLDILFDSGLSSVLLLVSRLVGPSWLVLFGLRWVGACCG